MYNTREFEMMVKELDPDEQLAIIGMFGQLERIPIAARKSGSEFNKTLNYGLNMARSYANDNSNDPLLNLMKPAPGPRSKADWHNKMDAIMKKPGDLTPVDKFTMAVGAMVVGTKTLPGGKPLTELEKKVIKWCKNNLAAGRIVKVVGAKDNGLREIISITANGEAGSMECHVLAYDLKRTGIKSKSSLKNIREVWLEPHQTLSGNAQWHAIKGEI